jgi:pyruvate formate-lyase/glycerol dehydratase family glycyl radical enzyme
MMWPSLGVCMPDGTSTIRYEGYTLDNLSLVERLKKAQLKIKPSVCIERARYVTRYLKDMSNSAESMELRYAKAVNYFLSNKEACFFDDNLLAGTTTSKPFGAPVYQELTGLTIWPELDTISKREKNPLLLSREEAEELNFKIFPYWMDKNILEHTRKKNGNPDCMGLMEKIVFFIASKAGTISHTIPTYTVALEKGIEHIISEAAAREATIRGENSLSTEDKQSMEFYQAVQIAMKGIIAYADSLNRKAAELARETTDPFQKKNFQAMANVCGRVPAKPTRTFREAANALWIIQIAIHAENINMAMSPGRLDQVLYPYYQNDIANGIITDRDALEILACLWLKLNDNTNLVPEMAEELFGGAGTVPAVTVGGIDENGNDAVNELTYLMLRVTELLKTRDPSMNARYHYEINSDEYRDRVAEVIINTKAVPAFHNDVVDTKTLMNQGITLEHARDYAIIGCVEMGIPGRSYDASSSIIFNLVSALEVTLYNGKRPVTGDDLMTIETGDPATFGSFEEFWEAFKRQLSWLIGKAIELNEYLGRTHQELMPTPLLSSFFEGPLDKGKDLIFGGALYNSSGATHIGFADTVDSLNAIEQAVFIDKKCTFAELIEALKTDFVNYEKSHAYLVNRTPKYGTDNPIAIKNAQNMIRFLYDFYQAHTNYRGGKYKPAYWTMTNHAGQGKLSGALPNGRKANQVFASGITPVSQAAQDLACLTAVGSLDSTCIPMGEALNLKYPFINGEEDLKKFSQAVTAYFKSGGLHVQFNIMSYEMLLDARKHPENHPELLVRVSGYSAYFKDLNDAMKEEIIRRTEYDIKSGKANPLPDMDS